MTYLYVYIHSVYTLFWLDQIIQHIYIIYIYIINTLLWTILKQEYSANSNLIAISRRIIQMEKQNIKFYRFKSSIYISSRDFSACWIIFSQQAIKILN